MRCPSEYQKSMVQHRRSGARKIALTYGTTWHSIMECHYKAAECSEADLIDQCVVAAADAWEDGGMPDDIRTLPRIILDYKKYLRTFGLPWKEERKTVGWPSSPAVELNGEVAVPGARHPYAYKIDRVVKTQGQYLVEDHKTTTRFDKNFFSAFELDNQMMGYAMAAQLITGQPIAGVRINAYVIHKHESIFESRTISYSQVRLDDWVRNLDSWLGRIEEAQMEYDARTSPSSSKNTDEQRAADSAFPMNLWACHGRKYGSCSYIGVCSMPPHLRQRVLENDFEQTPWNPLEAEDPEEAA